jgi:hypothetical protein
VHEQLRQKAAEQAVKMMFCLQFSNMSSLHLLNEDSLADWAIAAHFHHVLMILLSQFIIW